MKETRWFLVPKDAFLRQLQQFSRYLRYERQHDTMEVAVALAFDTKDPQYQRFLQELRENDIPMEHERCEFEVSEDELDTFEYVELVCDTQLSSADMTEYDEGEPCLLCGELPPPRVRDRIKVDLRKLRKGRVFGTFYDDVVVAHWVSKALSQFEGVRFQEVLYHGRKPAREGERLYRMLLSQLIPGDPLGDVVQKGEFCKACGYRDKFLYQSLLEYPSSALEGVNLALTSTYFGSPPSYSGRNIVIRQDVRRILKKLAPGDVSFRPVLVRT